jgi:hypothetical protein
MKVDAFTLDFEIFRKIQLLDCSTIELSAGARHSDFYELAVNEGNDVWSNALSAYGGIAGIEWRERYGCGELYARGRGAILMGNRLRFASNEDQEDGERLPDAVAAVAEISVGYEQQWCLANGGQLGARIGAEWQNWFSHSSSFGSDGDEIEDDILLGATDVGFGGFLIGLSYEN